MGRLDAMKMLVERGADIALKNTDGVTAGQIAAKNNFSDIAVFLAKPAHRKYQRHSGA
jgi:ankyrin repeat protein